MCEVDTNKSGVITLITEKDPALCTYTMHKGFPGKY